MADMEGQPRPSAGINLLENKIQELEERLRSEERYNNTSQVKRETEYVYLNMESYFLGCILISEF